MMEQNTFRFKNYQDPKGSFFSLIEKVFKLEKLFEDGIPVRFLPKMVFITVFGIIYIGNSHYAEKTIRIIDKIQLEVENLRADYTTLKADYMFDSKQSEVARKVASRGLHESQKPPFKIQIKRGEY